MLHAIDKLKFKLSKEDSKEILGTDESWQGILREILEDKICSCLRENRDS